MPGCDFIPKAPPVQELHLQSYCNYNYDTNQGVERQSQFNWNSSPSAAALQLLEHESFKVHLWESQKSPGQKAEEELYWPGRPSRRPGRRRRACAHPSGQTRSGLCRNPRCKCRAPSPPALWLPTFYPGELRGCKQHTARYNTLWEWSQLLSSTLTLFHYWLKCFAETDMVSAEYDLSCNNIWTRKRKSITRKFLDTFDWWADWTQTWILIFHRFIMDDFLLIIPLLHISSNILKYEPEAE